MEGPTFTSRYRDSRNKTARGSRPKTEAVCASRLLERFEEVLDLVVAEDRAVGADVLVADVAATALAGAALHLAFEFGHNSKSLVKQPDLCVVLSALRRNVHIAEHTTHARICVQTLAGHFRVRVGGRVFDLPQGQLPALDSGMPRDIEALEDSAFLRALNWREGARH